VDSELTTTWFERLAAGDSTAAQRAWQDYYGRLIALARRKLGGSARRVADEEDVVLVAFNSFLKGLKAGRFPKLADRHDLWQVLVMLTARKAIDQREYENRQKRGGGKKPIAAHAGHGSDSALLSEAIGTEPTPAFATEVAEELESLLAALGDLTLTQIAVGKLEGYTNQELAQQIGCGVRTIERKLNLIRAVWEQRAKT
jgi:DNA-directed RNA polymerase specialized sigma24 family protein